MVTFLLAVTFVSIVEVNSSSRNSTSAATIELAISPSVVQATVGVPVSNLYSVSYNGSRPTFALYSDNPGANEPNIGTGAPAGLSFNTQTGLLSGTPDSSLPSTRYWILDGNGSYYDDFTLVINHPTPICPTSMGDYLNTQSMDFEINGADLGYSVSTTFPILRIKHDQTWSEFTNGTDNDGAGITQVEINSGATRATFRNLPPMQIGQYQTEYKTSATTSCQSILRVMRETPDPVVSMSSSIATVNQGSEIVLLATATFESGVSGSFRWGKGSQGSEISLTDDSRISGSTTNELRINNSELLDEDRYFVVITSSADFSYTTSLTREVIVEVVAASMGGGEGEVVPVADSREEPAADTQVALASTNVQVVQPTLKVQENISNPDLLQLKTLPATGVALKQFLSATFLLLTGGFLLTVSSRRRRNVIKN